jgi:hypothetical protein
MFAFLGHLNERQPHIPPFVNDIIPMISHAEPRKSLNPSIIIVSSLPSNRTTMEILYQLLLLYRDITQT